ncbi:MAG: DUF1579 family protein [Burkholderiales bacterium]|nr:DUF1579 family protein [Burkholderiales bacterium]
MKKTMQTLCSAALFSASQLTSAQTTPTPAPAPAAAPAAATSAPCISAEHHAFDFWIGHWDVFKPDGSLAGSNKIEREYNGCVIHERYTTPHGFAGESLNAYDSARKVWHQTWMDNGGTVLLLDGGIQGNSMVLLGNGQDSAGKQIRHRITWTPKADGNVRQHWESTDEKGNWTTVFDGLYKRKTSK